MLPKDKPKRKAGAKPGQKHRHSAVDWRWYAHRLGLVDAHGRISPRHGTQEAHNALEFFLLAFVDSGRFTDGGIPTKPRALARWGRREEDGEMGWSPPRRTHWSNPEAEGYVGDPKIVQQGSFLGVGEVLAQVFRARLCTALGVSPDEMNPAAPQRKRVNRWFTKVQSEAVTGGMASDLLLGWDRDEPIESSKPDEPMRPTIEHGPLTESRVGLPGSVHWWWMSGGVDLLRAVVVDMDLHLNGKPTEADMKHLRLRVAAFTQTPGVPKPHLVVTSKSGGFHLWYLVDERSGPAYDDKPIRDARRFANALAEGLRVALGADLAKARIEVFPNSDSPKAKMPAIPFGPLSYLCAEDGMTVEAKDPIEAMVRWRRRFPSGVVPRYRLSDFQAITADGADPTVLEALRTAPPSLVERDQRRASVRMPEPPEYEVAHRAAEVPDAPDTTHLRPPARCGRDVCEDAYRDGPADGHTNVQLPLVTRWLKFGLGLDAEEAEHQLLVWVKRGNGSLRGSTEKSWLDRFRSWWHYWEFGFGAGCLVYDGDIRWAIEVVTRPGMPTTLAIRKAHLQVLLLIVGRARDQGDTGPLSRPVVLKTTHARKKAHKSFTRKSAGEDHPLITAGILTIAREAWHAISGCSTGPSFATAYQTQLPPVEGAAHTVPDRYAMRAAIATVVDRDPALAKRFARTMKGWRQFRDAAFKRKQQP